MQLLRHSEIDRDMKTLKKKFRTPEESLEAWCDLFSVKGLEETPAIEKCNGYGSHQIYKGRVIPLKENCGKSQGYRVIFKMESDRCIIIFFSRHGIYKTEQELINTVRYRLNNLTTV